MTDAEVRVIACDESASEGENLIASRHPVFVHASVNLTMEDACVLARWTAALSSSAVSVACNRALLLSLRVERRLGRYRGGWKAVDSIFKRSGNRFA